MQNKPHKIELLMFLIAVIILGIGLYYLGPSITGFVIKEFSYEDGLNLVVTSSGNYTWQLANIGDLKSVKIDGRVTNHGKAKVYLVGNGIKYLVFDSSRIGEGKETESNESGNLMTGFAVKENETESNKDRKNNKPDWTSGVNEFVVNGTTIINLSQYFTDEDNDTLIYSADEAEGLEI